MTDREFEMINSRFDRIEEKIDDAIETGGKHRLELERRITRMETEARIVRWLGGASGGATVALVIHKLTELI